MRLAFLFGLAALTTPGAALGQDPPIYKIDLVCLGAGSANQPTNSTVFVWDNPNPAAANVVGNRAVPYDDQVNLHIEGDKSRVRMPRAMLPIARGGENGWFRIKNLEIAENEITGSVAVNFMNNPKLRIDRVTGTISIAGKAGHYSGSCTAYDPDAVERAF